MDRFVENPTSCHSVSFAYSIAGNNPGSLSLMLRKEDGSPVRSLWSSSQTTNGWRVINIPFRYWERFRVSFDPILNALKKNLFEVASFEVHDSGLNILH